jgi:predicted MFS family arabinose efflux permease
VASSNETDRAGRRRWLALYVLCAGVLIDVLDATIVNVALPSIKRDLGFSQSGLAWVLNAYLIAFGGLRPRQSECTGSSRRRVARSGCSPAAC